MSHQPEWKLDNGRVSEKLKERGFEGYSCEICYMSVIVPPGGLPSMERHPHP